MQTRITLLRRCFVAVLIVALALIGAGRGLALADTQSQMTMVIDGVVVTICHTGAGDTSNAPGDRQHDCCDACTLLAPTTLPSPPELAAPISIAYVVEHTQALEWVPVLARPRSPRQSQGPPTA